MQSVTFMRKMLQSCENRPEGCIGSPQCAMHREEWMAGCHNGDALPPLLTYCAVAVGFGRCAHELPKEGGEVTLVRTANLETNLDEG